MSTSGFVANIWAPYGLRQDPFFQAELRPESTEYPVRELFVGRAGELKRIGRRIGGADSSRTVVEGPAGVGKTSFVNRLKLDLADAGYVVHDAPIRLTDATTPDRFLADVLRVLVRSHTSGGKVRDTFWTNTADLVESRMLRSGGLSIMGSGGEMSQHRLAAEAGPPPLLEVVEEASVRFYAAYGVAHVFHVNNLENLTLAQEEHARLLVQNVRDVFLAPKAHWLMVGASGTDERVFRRAEQVAGIFPPSEVLGPLSADEVRELLERRYRHLKIKRTDLVRPVDPEAVVQLYTMYRGDLRNFLSLLSDAANLLLGVEGVVPMSVDAIVASAGARYWAAIQQKVSDKDLQHLKDIGARSQNSGFRVTDVARWRKFSQAAGSKLLGRLSDAGLIREERQEGRSTFYRLSGVASVALAAATKSA